MPIQAEPGVLSGADPMVPRVTRVVRARRETADVWTLEIEPGPDGARFAPGQFNMLYIFGVGEIAISVSGDPGRPEKLIHTIRAVGQVSAALARLKAGDQIGIRGPFGTGWPVETAVGSDVVVVAGGLGLAPLRPALYRLFAERERYGRLLLLYGTRSPADILFEKELARWRKRLDVEVEVTVDRGSGDWHGHVGVVTRLIARADFDAKRTIAMVCGPEIMMRFAATALETAGVPDSAVYISLERNMKCAIGHCGHCQFAGDFVCKDGPVVTYQRVRDLIGRTEI